MVSNFGANIKQLRINRNVTQAVLAKAVGVSVQAVSKWECGGTPDVELLPAIADFFDTTIDSLFGRACAEERNMEKQIINLLKRTPNRDKMMKACELCWALFKGVSNIPNVEETELAKVSSENGAYFDEKEACTRALVGINGGLAYACALQEMPSFIFMREPDDGFSYLLKEETQYQKLFSALSDPIFFRTLLFLYKREPVPFSLEHICKVQSLSLEKAASILNSMQALGWIEKETVELESGVKALYRPVINACFIPFLFCAKEMLHTVKLWYLRCVPRTNPWLENKSNQD